MNNIDRVSLLISTLLQLSKWLDDLKQDLQQSGEYGDNAEVCQRNLEQFLLQRDATLEACINTIAEGEALLRELR